MSKKPKPQSISLERAIQLSEGRLHIDTLKWLVEDEIANEKNIVAYVIFDKNNPNFMATFEEVLGICRDIKKDNKVGFKFIIEWIRNLTDLKEAERQLFKINAIIEPILTREAKRRFSKSHNFNPRTRKGGKLMEREDYEEIEYEKNGEESEHEL